MTVGATPIRLLVVDDDEVDRIAIRRALDQSELDVTIDEEQDADRVVGRVQRERYDCLILDYELPAASGLDLVRALRAAGVELPILVLTGHGSEDLAVRVMKAGASDYLSKSRLSAGRLERRLRALLRIGQAEQHARRAQRELAAERQLLAGVLKELPTGVILAAAPGGEVLLSNVEVDRLLGSAVELGRSAAHRAFHPDGRPMAPGEWPLARTIATSERVVGEDVEVKLADGERLVLRASSSPVHGPTGEVVAAVMTLDDITELRRGQEAMREEAALVETLYQIGESLVTQLNSELLVDEVTHAATRLTGAEFGAFYYSSQGDDGRAFFRQRIAGASEAADGISADELRATSTAITPIIAQTFRTDGVVRLDDIRTDPRYRQIPSADAAPSNLSSYLSVPVTSASGGLIGALFFGHSRAGAFTVREERIAVGIAAWASVAMDNARLYEAQEHGARLREEMLSIVSHDLRNPLNAISIAAEELLETDIDQIDRERYVGAIRRAVVRSDSLIRDLLDVGRIEAGGLAVEKAPLTVERILEQSRSDHEMLAEERGIVLDLSIGDGVGAVKADRERVLQVLGNLIGNALKYSSRGGRIGLCAERDGDMVRFFVRDTGAGIDPHVLPHIFDRFWQAEHQGRAGAGLGLAICRGIVEAHGGTIAARSVPGDGSEFCFTLPAAD